MARSIAKELKTEIGRRPATGGVALESVVMHPAGAHSPLVTLDGVPQHVTPSGAAAWARGLASASAATAAATTTAGATKRPKPAGGTVA